MSAGRFDNSRIVSFLSFFANDEQAAAAEQDAREQAARVEEIRWLMSDARGRRFVWRQLDAAGLYRLSFSGENAAQTNFNEGQRNLGLWLLAEVTEHCPAEYLVMLKEQQT